MHLLRYKGNDPSAVDPYWDFEHEPGAAYDMDARRLWRARVFISGIHRARVRLRLELHQEAHEGESKTLDLSPTGHILHFTGGADLSPDSYAPISSQEIMASPPMLVLAVNLTRLHPGYYVLTTDVLGSDQEEKEMRFRLSRRPFYTYHDPSSKSAPPGRLSIRSRTGLQEVVSASRRRLLTAHCWPLHRSTWAANPSGLGYVVERRDVLAVTLFRPDASPELTRWRPVEPGAVADPVEWSPDAFPAWRSPDDHAAAPDAGFGLPFPTLVGLPRQPVGDGGYDARPVRRG